MERSGEGALALRLHYGTRIIGRFGRVPMPALAAAGAMASLASPESGRADYVTRAARGYGRLVSRSATSSSPTISPRPRISPTAP